MTSPNFWMNLCYRVTMSGSAKPDANKSAASARPTKAALKRMLRPGKCLFPNRTNIRLDRTKNTRLSLHEVFNKPRPLAGKNPKHVVQHQYLARTLDPGADANRRDDQLLRHLTSQQRRHRFDHDQLRAGILKRLGIAAHLLCTGIGFSLHLEPAKRMHRLRRQPHMSADGDRPV